MRGRLEGGTTRIQQRKPRGFHSPVVGVGFQFLRLVMSHNFATPSPVNDSPQSEDAADIREKLAKEIGRVPWSYLAPHAATGSLFFVDPGLELDEVGAAIASNRTDLVQHWLKAGDLLKIEAIHAAQWEEDEIEFEALVVLPYVLCRPCQAG
jgi:hypothetical protein